MRNLRNSLVVFFLLLLGLLGLPVTHTSNMHMHGGVKMGVKNDLCDNGEENLDVDWDGSAVDYKCYFKPKYKHYMRRWSKWRMHDGEPHKAFSQCKNVDDPIHECMSVPIHYKDKPPLGGHHRPLWAMYGEYRYLPPQRWIHNLEHGAAVFLYHPCASQRQIQKLRCIAHTCLWRHIITPYRHLPVSRPFAIITWGCKLSMKTVSEESAVDFLKKHSIDHKLPEWRMTENGQFNKELKQNATIVTNEEDKIICPRKKHFPNSRRFIKECNHILEDEESIDVYSMRK